MAFAGNILEPFGTSTLVYAGAYYFPSFLWRQTLQFVRFHTSSPYFCVIPNCVQFAFRYQVAWSLYLMSILGDKLIFVSRDPSLLVMNHDTPGSKTEFAGLRSREITERGSAAR